MSKAARNTIFTAVVLLCTAVAVSWNRQIAYERDPISISQQVLTSPITTEESLDLPLTINITRPKVNLGQVQTIQVKTVPFAKLGIVLIQPDGEVERSQTIQVAADELGNYQSRFRLSDFHNLGAFEVTVEAQADGLTSRAKANFVLQSWADPIEGDESKYVYPLVP